MRRQRNIFFGLGVLVFACRSPSAGAERSKEAWVARPEKTDSAPTPPEKETPDAGAATMKSPKDECETLMNAVLPFTEQMLTAHREFYPFGGAMKPSGEIVQVGGRTSGEHPPSQEVIDILESGFRKAAAIGQYKATALVVDMRIVPPGKSSKQDGVAVRLDHRDGYSAAVVFPYTFSDDGKVVFEQPFAAAGENRIFSR